MRYVDHQSVELQEGGSYALYTAWFLWSKAEFSLRKTNQILSKLLSGIQVENPTEVSFLTEHQLSKAGIKNAPFEIYMQAFSVLAPMLVPWSCSNEHQEGAVHG